MTQHPLDPLLAPRSIAFIGASVRPDTPGNSMVRMPKLAGFAGRLYPINPNYDSVEGLRCFPSLAALPETVDHVVLGVANARLEAALDDAIAHGARAATIFASGVLDHDTAPRLSQRIARKAKAAGLALCGGNCMGFYNLPLKLRVVGFPSDLDMPAGSISFIAQSGSVFGALSHNDRRLKFNLSISSGGEWVTSSADYLDWALAQETTRVAALFLESVRDPARFVAALQKAAERNIPVVVLKVGRTPESAAMALSHTGAIAGSDAAYDALFARYGVIRVDSLDEMAATLLLLSHPKRPGKGGLVAMHDSGGERELAVDLAADAGVAYARIERQTVQRLAARLDPGLDPVNPLDAWGIGNDVENQFADLMTALIEDDNAAIGVLFADVRDGYYLSEAYTSAMIRAAARSEKPIAVATNYAMVRHEKLALRVTEAGVPVLDGTEEALRAVRHALAYRDFLARPVDTTVPGTPSDRRAAWSARLKGEALSESEGLDLLADYGIATPPRRLADTEEAVWQAAREIGYPVALKTAMPGIQHKTDRGGVRLGLVDEAALAAAYADMTRRLGPKVLVQRMADKGVEIGLGAINDPNFGPYVMIAAGGVLIELLADRVVALAPIGRDTARTLIARLKVARLLDGVRGGPKLDIDALADCLARLSVLAWDNRDRIAEIDINPVIVTQNGCMAVDALVVPHRPKNESR